MVDSPHKDVHQKIETLEEHLVYRDEANPWVTLYFNQVVFPGGKQGRFNRIVEGTGKPSVAVLPLLPGKVGLVRQYRYPIETFLWEIPRGFGDSKDSILEALRELYEETGITIDRDQLNRNSLIELGKIHPNSGLLASETQIYAVRCELAAELSQPVDSEIMQLAWFTVDDVLAKVAAFEITDAFTLCALFRAQALGLLPLT